MPSTQAELTIKDLPKQDNNGVDYVYTIVEEKIDGYTSEVESNTDGLITITNKQEIPKTSVKVTKACHSRQTMHLPAKMLSRTSTIKICKTRKNWTKFFFSNQHNCDKFYSHLGEPSQ